MGTGVAKTIGSLSVTRTNKPFHGLLLSEQCMVQQCLWALQHDTDKFCNSVDSQNVEFEGGQQNNNMMGFLLLKAVYEYTHYFYSGKIITGNNSQVYHSKKSNKPANKYHKEIP